MFMRASFQICVTLRERTCDRHLHLAQVQVRVSLVCRRDPSLRSVPYQLSFVLKLRIQAMQADTSIGVRELPLDFCGIAIAGSYPGLASSIERR